MAGLHSPPGVLPSYRPVRRRLEWQLELWQALSIVSRAIPPLHDIIPRVDDGRWTINPCLLPTSVWLWASIVNRQSSIVHRRRAARQETGPPPWNPLPTGVKGFIYGPAFGQDKLPSVPI